ncbi:hypothetical protein J4417_02515, partial [Candidatus Woesearchaeota archaeon]|nr:hypothetical protein [Candidatus Woesearchaeota archaeon]
EFGAPTNMEADDLISFGLLVYKMATGKNLIDVPGKETMGHDAYANEIDRMKLFLYRDGKLTEEYRKKVVDVLEGHPPIKKYSEAIAARVDPEIIGSMLRDGALREQDDRGDLVKIILCALEDQSLDEIKYKYQSPYIYKIMDAKELRKFIGAL